MPVRKPLAEKNGIKEKLYLKVEDLSIAWADEAVQEALRLGVDVILVI